MLKHSKHGTRGFFVPGILFCLFSSINSGAQSKIDSSNYLNDKVVYVVDGIPVNKVKVNNEDILTKDVLKGPAIEALHSEKQIDSVIVIVTKNSAVTQYQKKLGAFSKKYKNYLQSHRNIDEDFLYVVDGIPVQGERSDIIKTLYKIPSGKIKEVGFNKKKPTDLDKMLVVITTKQ